MDEILAIRPFVPARDFALSKALYLALGFGLTHEGGDVAILKQGSLILQTFYDRTAAENTMVQLLLRDVDAWWSCRIPGDLTARSGVSPPVPPALQSWGMRVGFIHDPSGVLWHAAEVPF